MLVWPQRQVAQELAWPRSQLRPWPWQEASDDQGWAGQDFSEPVTRIPPVALSMTPTISMRQLFEPTTWTAGGCEPARAHKAFCTSLQRSPASEFCADGRDCRSAHKSRSSDSRAGTPRCPQRDNYLNSFGPLPANFPSSARAGLSYQCPQLTCGDDPPVEVQQRWPTSSFPTPAATRRVSRRW